MVAQGSANFLFFVDIQDSVEMFLVLLNKFLGELQSPFFFKKIESPSCKTNWIRFNEIADPEIGEIFSRIKTQTIKKIGIELVRKRLGGGKKNPGVQLVETFLER